jgi:hypothetical protein
LRSTVELAAFSTLQAITTERDRKGVVPAKIQIVGFLGDKALVLPALLDAAIIGNEQAKYVLSIFQLAASNSECPERGGASSLQADREACGIPDMSFDHSVMESVSDGHGSLYIPGAQRLMATLDNGVQAMLAPLGLMAEESKQAQDLHQGFRARMDRLIAARAAVVDDMISDKTIADMTSGRPASGIASTSSLWICIRRSIDFRGRYRPRK